MHGLDGGAGGRRTDQFRAERGEGSGGGSGGRGGLCAGWVKQVAVGPHYLQVGRAPSMRGQMMSVLMLLLLLLLLSLLLVLLLGQSWPQRDGGRRPVGSRPDVSFLLGPSISLPICVGRKRAWEGRRRRSDVVEIAWRRPRRRVMGRKPFGRCGRGGGGGGGGGGGRASEEVFVAVDAPHFSSMRHGGPTYRSSPGCILPSSPLS